MQCTSIKFIRHSYSIANQYAHENNGKRPHESIFKNAGLHSNGFNLIKHSKDKIMKKIGSYDIIITSPIKRGNTDMLTNA